MIFGVSKSVRTTIHQEDFEITEADVTKKYCYELISQKTDDLVNMSYQFFDFSPRVFHQIRMLYGINPNDYLKSIGPENLIGSMVMGNVPSLKE